MTMRLADNRPIIYFDHAATSWPKPPCVSDAMQRFMAETGANPGRSGHSMSVDAARVVFETREAVAEFFGLDDSANVAFAINATHALNIAICGLVSPGDHVITTSMEHNSVMRPLTELVDSADIAVSRSPVDSSSKLDLAALESLFRDNTKLVVATHASNVTGLLNPVRELGAICRSRGVPFLVDAAQSAGCVPIDVVADNIDLLAFTGHKSLMGPQGIGGLCVNSSAVPLPLYRGGTGSRSDEERQPGFMPDRLEAGTPNGVGIAGLHAGIKWINDMGLAEIAGRESRLRAQLVSGLYEVPGVKVYSGELPVVSFTIEGLQPSDIGHRLDRQYGIMTRVGLHCAPGAHCTIGTSPLGTVRMSLGYANTEEQVAVAVRAIAEIAGER
jgi:cysteine desulfurase family protein